MIDKLSEKTIKEVRKILTSVSVSEKVFRDFIKTLQKKESKRLNIQDLAVIYRYANFDTKMTESILTIQLKKEVKSSVESISRLNILARELEIDIDKLHKQNNAIRVAGSIEDKTRKMMSMFDYVPISNIGDSIEDDIKNGRTNDQIREDLREIAMLLTEKAKGAITTRKAKKTQVLGKEGDVISLESVEEQTHLPDERAVVALLAVYEALESMSNQNLDVLSNKQREESYTKLLEKQKSDEESIINVRVEGNE